MQQHLQEGQVVAPGRVERAAARPELRRRRHALERLQHEAAVGLARVQARLARALLRRGLEAAVLHAERREDLVAEVRVERLAAGGFDKAAHPVRVDPVEPAVTRIEHERLADRGHLAGGARRQPGRLDVAPGVRVPQVVAEACRVRQQVAQRDRPLGRAQLRGAAGVEALQHLRRAERGVDVGHRLVELEFALLDELHRRDRGDGLGHRGDPEQAVERHRWPLIERAGAEGPLVEQALVGGRQRHDTGYLARVHRLA